MFEKKIEILETEKIQVWKNGMMMRLIPLNQAKKMVIEGDFSIINSQAINYQDS